ncbi:uncharacterized protein [Penaeus vannamei]|uniref:uncharacterized protein n=1 Tax=Penaeus vannamei TaxID=6689 RepID=UPI00387F79F6
MSYLGLCLLLLSSTTAMAFYKEVDASSVTSPVPCGSWVWIPTGGSVTFTSPNYPGDYTWSLCYWKFYANSSDAHIVIDCSDFLLQDQFLGMCLSDALFIEAGLFNCKSFCGSEGPQSEVVNNQWAKVKFKADLFNHFRGFTCTATAVGEATTTPAVVTTTAPVVATTTAPVVVTTTAPVVVTTTAPVVATTTAPVVVTTTAPVVATTTAPVVVTTTAPVVATTTAPVVATTTAPVVVTTTAPVVVTTTAPVVVTTTAAP